MVEIYEVIIDKKIKSEEEIVDADFPVMNTLNEASIPYKKEIQEKEINDLGSERKGNYLVISVDEQYVEKVKELIGEELCMEDANSNLVQKIGGQPLNESHARESKLLDDFYEEEIFENAFEEIDIDECKKIFDSIKDKYNKAMELSPKFVVLSAFFGCIFLIILAGYIYVAFSGAQLPIELDNKFIILIFCSIIIPGVFGTIATISALKISKYEKIFTEKIIKPSLKAFLPECEFTKQGISKEYFKKAEVIEDFKNHYIFESKNKIIGEINSKKIILAEVELKDKMGLYIYSATFAKSKIEKWHAQRTQVEVFFDEGKNEPDIEVFQNDSNIEISRVNYSFRDGLLELCQKYNLEFSLDFEGDVVYVLIDDFVLLPEMKKFFKNDFSKENLLKSVNIIKEIIELANLF